MRFLLAIALTLLPAASLAEITGKPRIIDGDTIEISDQRIRLYGIGCPEKRQAFGKRAKQFTSRLTYGKDITVHVYEQDRYGRSIADVMLPDGRVLNHELIKAGFAWWYRKYAPENEALEQLEQEARAAKRGLWADANAVSSWEWRSGKKRCR